MLKSKISLQMYTVRKYTQTIDGLAATLEKLADIGFRTLQYTVPANYDAKEVKALFDANGITNDSVYCPAMKLADETDRVVAQCELFDTDHVRMDSLPSEWSYDADGYRRFAAHLNTAAEGYRKYGIKFLYHFHAFEFIRCEGALTGIDLLIRETDPSLIQIIPDTHWIHSGGKNPSTFLTRYADRYDYVHVKDFGIDVNTSIREARPIRFAPVGEGNLDWDDILTVCRNNNVRSYAIEQDDCYGRDEFECAASSFNFLKTMGVDD